MAFHNVTRSSLLIKLAFRIFFDRTRILVNVAYLANNGSRTISLCTIQHFSVSLCCL